MGTTASALGTLHAPHRRLTSAWCLVMTFRTALSIALALAVGGAPLLAQTAAAIPNIAGTWVLIPDSAASRTASRGPASSLLGLGPNATITQETKTLSIARTSPAGAVTSVYNLDGTASPNRLTFGAVVIEPVSRIKIDSGKVAITTRMDMNGSVYETTMSLSLDAGGVLVVHTTTPGSPGGAAPLSMIARYRKG